MKCLKRKVTEMNIRCNLFGHDYVLQSYKALLKPHSNINPDLTTKICRHCNNKKQTVDIIWEMGEYLSVTQMPYDKYLKENDNDTP